MGRYRKNDSGDGVLACIVLAIILGIMVAAALDFREDYLYGDTHQYSDKQEESDIPFGMIAILSLVFGLISLAIYGVFEGISDNNNPEEERRRILERHPPYRP